VRAARVGGWQPGLMLSWLLAPAVAALIESAVGHSIFQARYLLVSLPAVSLFAAWALFERPLLPAGSLSGSAALAMVSIRQRGE